MRRQLKEDIGRSRVQLPSSTSIKNFVHHLNRKAGMMNQMKLSDLRKYAEAHYTVPEDQDCLSAGAYGAGA
uniref:Uncharacterized protein n=1 Tax=Ditylenchus dipsaci TaxID=166011 RepID=A0A915CV24_9BILA